MSKISLCAWMCQKLLSNRPETYKGKPSSDLGSASHCTLGWEIFKLHIQCDNFYYSANDKILWNLRSIDAGNCILKDDQGLADREENKRYSR